jgi:hypothetical protein
MSVDEEWDKSGALPAPAGASAPPEVVDSSLLLLAKDLMPPSRAVEPAPDVSANIDRHVPELPLWTRAWRWLRFNLATIARKLRLDRLGPRQRKIVVGGAALLLVVAVIAFASSGGTAAPKQTVDLGQRARELTANGKYHDAVAAYEAMLMQHPRHAADGETVADLGRIADAGDPETATSALGILALQMGKAGHGELLARTASKSVVVRHQAVALAEGAGLGNRIDHVASWMVDLEQATDCDQRRAIVAKIVATHDKRVASAQREAAHYNCLATEPKPAEPKPPEPKPAATKQVATKQPATKHPASRTPAPTSEHHRPKPHW